MNVSAPAPMSAMVICFPQRRNVGKVRHVAQHLMRRPEGRARETYWNQVCNRMAGTMAKAGIGDDQITHQINAFAEAVSWEMHRLACDSRQRPGGAA